MVENAISRAKRDLATIIRYMEVDDVNPELMDDIEDLIDKLEEIKRLSY